MNNNYNIDQVSVDNIRQICLEMIDKAASGHPGMALGSAPLLHTLYTKVINVSPKNPNWANRDRFILSSGHASSLLYTILHLSKFNISMDDLRDFRQLGSITPGHPENYITDGIDASTGPLGQGLAYAVGTAIAESYMHNKFPELIDHYTYTLCGDGDIQEGIFYEVLSLAGVLNLNKLIVFYDSNDIQLDGRVDKCYDMDIKKLVEATHWNYIKVEDGNDMDAILKAAKKAKKSTKPTLIEVKTIIGYGAKMQGTNKVHGAPLPHEETLELREKLGGSAFVIPDEIYDYYKKAVYNRGNKLYNKWAKLPQSDLFKEFLRNEHKVDFSKIPAFDMNEAMPTRNASGKILKEISKQDPFFIGGAADIASSTKAIIEGGEFNKENRDGRNILFGVRENAMGSIANAITMYGLKSFASTFFAFSDYMKPSLRLAAISHLPTIFIFSHDSIAVGEDGPTHQPVDQLSMCRAIPNTYVIRPCDANETRYAYEFAYNQKEIPSMIVLTRQSVPQVTSDGSGLCRGAYILSKEEKRLDGILIASGSEVKLALDAKELLKQKGYDVRVVSMPCTKLFDKQSKEYKEEVLPKFVSRKLAIEMGEANHYYKYVGTFGKVFLLDQFGVSGKASDVIKHFEFTAENIEIEFENLHDYQFIDK
ncbi:MAG: transketolase [Bacilli bacterium]|nr:transketolase [Bacilli bacterium]